MKKTVFVDGQHGTTGLKNANDWKAAGILLSWKFRKRSAKTRRRVKKLLNEADIVFLCLPG